MAHIFKHFSGKEKGILVFTHKELYNSDIVETFLSKEIKDKYFIGCHYGWYMPNTTPKKYIDFHMGKKSTVSFDSKVFRIPLNSRNFTEKIFSNWNQSRYWDIASISHGNQNKKVDKILEQARRLYDLKKEYKILLILTANTKEEELKKHIAFYHENFSKKEKELFTLMVPSPVASRLGFSRSQIAHFLNSSKVLTLFSKTEGESRIISEGLLCGNIVVADKNLRGGGLDYLDNKNSALFEDIDLAYLSWISAVEEFPVFEYNQNKLYQQLHETQSIKTLKDYFNKLYVKHGMRFDYKLINTDNLNFRLPAHDDSVPWVSYDRYTSDIFSKEQFMAFVGELK